MIFKIFPYQNFPKYFSKISELFLEIILRNFPKYFSKMSEVFLETFRNSSPNVLKWFSKFSDIILWIFRNIFRKFPNYFWKLFSEICLSKVSEVFLEICEIFLENFEMIFEIFCNNSQNFSKYFFKYYEIILKIFRNNYQNFPKLFWKFSKYSSKFRQYFLTVLTMRIFFVVNIFSLMFFCRKTSYSGGKSKNKKLLLKIARFIPPSQIRSSTGKGGGVSEQVWGREVLNIFSVIKPWLETFSFSFP